MSIAVETLIAETCCRCGVFFGIGSGFRQQRLTDGKDFYCPNGHAQHYTDNTEALLAREREARRKAELRARANLDLLAAEERSHNATKGHLTRHRKRAAAGVCPCCQRTFKDLARHMEGQHPDYVKRARKP